MIVYYDHGGKEREREKESWPTVTHTDGSPVIGDKIIVRWYEHNLLESNTDLFKYNTSIYNNPELIKVACVHVWGLWLGWYFIEFLITRLSKIVERTFTKHHTSNIF